ncbi:MAG: ornithine cyclodeaminase family protein [Nitrososphaerales archaeon]
MRTVLYLNDDDVRPLVKMSDILAYCEEAYRLYGRHQAGKLYAHFAPISSYPTKVPHTDVDYRSGVMEGIPAICSTLGWGFWDNPAKYGLPSVSVVTALNDVKTGLLLSLISGYYLGAARTGAAGGVASKYLARAASSSLGIVGTGNVGHYMLWSHLELFKGIDVVKAWSRDGAKARKFAMTYGKQFGVKIEAVGSLREAVEGMDIVCAAVPTREPLIKGEWVGRGTHINAFGADSKGKQELDPGILQRADKIVVDSMEQCRVAGEINVPLSQGLISEGKVYGQIGELVNGWKKGREGADELTVMDSTGVSALDIVTYYRAYEKSLRAKVGTKLALSGVK